jgi:hypothetical protein
VWRNRPWVCRQYTCADRQDIWDDFARMVPTERVRELTRLRAKAAAATRSDGE